MITSKDIRIIAYFFLTILLLVLSFTPVGYSLYIVIKTDEMILYLFLPLILFVSYCFTVLTFGVIHSQIVLRFTIGSKPVKAGNYPHSSPEGRLIGVRLTADGIFKSMLKVFTFLPIIWGMFLFPYGMRLYGLKTGKNVYIATNTYVETAGLVEIGDHSFIGYGSGIAGHVHENREVIISPIKIGKKVTIGANSAISLGTEIGDNSIIGAYSGTSKGSKIPSNEIWVGLPAKFLKKRNDK